MKSKAFLVSLFFLPLIAISKSDKMPNLVFRDDLKNTISVSGMPPYEQTFSIPRDITVEINIASLPKGIKPTKVLIINSPTGTEMADARGILAKIEQYEKLKNGNLVFKYKFARCDASRFVISVDFSNNERIEYGMYGPYECKSASNKPFAFLEPSHDHAVWKPGNRIALRWKGGDPNFLSQIRIGCMGCRGNINLAELPGSLQNYTFDLPDLEKLKRDLIIKDDLVKLIKEIEFYLNVDQSGIGDEDYGDFPNTRIINFKVQ